MTTVVIDASVWVAAVDGQDPSYQAARACLHRLAAGDIVVVVPMHARVEVACALGRRFADPEAARTLTEALFSAAFLREVPVTEELAREALLLGTASRLRAADALYAAVAVREGATLITLDGEMIERANGVLPTG